MMACLPAPATDGRLFEGRLFIQRCRQQEVLLKGIQTALFGTTVRATSIKHAATLTMSTTRSSVRDRRRSHHLDH
jgi:hypothetical protein